jgi:L-cystine uptake protein TcyP (sodium:dicarboxylate symporter family)
VNFVSLKCTLAQQFGEAIFGQNICHCLSPTMLAHFVPSSFSHVSEIKNYFGKV